MINEMRDYPGAKTDDQVDAVARLPRVRNRRRGRRLLQVANWLLTTLILTVVPYVIGYIAMRMIRFMVAPPTPTTQVEWVFALWCLGLVTLAALVTAILGAYTLINTTRKM